MPAEPVLDWLLEGDPTIRWQALQDLAGAAPRTVQREQRQVAETGWGARLLALQDPDGRWARGIYTPKWTSTTYTLLLLRSFGLPRGNPQALGGCRQLLDQGVYGDGGINFYPRVYRHSETCTTGMVLAVVCWFGLDDRRVDGLAEHLAGQQMADGGWNCCAAPGYGHATHGSFHTTISVLEGLLEYERFRGRPGASPGGPPGGPQKGGREFLLTHRMFRSHRTGAIVNPAMTRFSFPPRWHYDVLRGLDYFRESGAEWDDRLADAIELVEKRRKPDGRWLLQNRYPGKTFFELEELGKPSRWNTLRAQRVLRWWQNR
jgi:hypothetical protein